MTMLSSILGRVRVFLRSYPTLNSHVRISGLNMKVPSIPKTCGNQKRGYTMKAGTPGAGVGKGGGGGGAVREAGGGLGRFAATQEEGYFYRKQREQLEKIKNKLKDSKDEEFAKPKTKAEPPNE